AGNVAKTGARTVLTSEQDKFQRGIPAFHAAIEERRIEREPHACERQSSKRGSSQPGSASRDSSPERAQGDPLGTPDAAERAQAEFPSAEPSEAECSASESSERGAP